MNRPADQPGRELVEVGWASGGLEAQMIKGLLESEGIRCLVRSTRTGGRALIVRAVDAVEAAALLAEAETRARTEADTLPDFADYEDPEGGG